MKRVTMLNITIIVATALVLPGIFSPVYAHGDKEEDHTPVIKGAVAYSADIKPVFEKRCAKCHGQDSPEHAEFIRDKRKFKAMGKGPRMDSYTRMLFFIGWPDTGAVMRRLDDGKDTKDGRPGNMYKKLGDTEEERQRNLAVFKKWIGNWTLKRWAAAEKEDLDQIKVTY